MDLQPHRTRYWRTARLDAQFKERAEQVLWCYGNAERLARQGIWAVAVDEMPNLQVLERRPDPASHPGLHRATGVRVHPARDGQPAVVPDRPHGPDGGGRRGHEGRRALHPGVAGPFAAGIAGLKGVFLIQDGDPSHTAGDTAAYWSGCRGWWRPRFTPAHASWLNQAELLIGAFGYHYLKRGSWGSREEFIEHVLASAPEYNQPLRPPFEWTWTNQKMRQWFAKHAS